MTMGPIRRRPGIVNVGTIGHVDLPTNNGHTDVWLTLEELAERYPECLNGEISTVDLGCHFYPAEKTELITEHPPIQHHALSGPQRNRGKGKACRPWEGR